MAYKACRSWWRGQASHLCSVNLPSRTYLTSAGKHRLYQRGKEANELLELSPEYTDMRQERVHRATLPLWPYLRFFNISCLLEFFAMPYKRKLQAVCISFGEKWLQARTQVPFQSMKRCVPNFCNSSEGTRKLKDVHHQFRHQVGSP